MRVFVDDACFDAAGCRRIRDAISRGAAEDAEILADGIVTNAAVRHTSSIEIDDETLAVVEAALDARRDAIAGFHECVIGEREGPGFLRYPTGGFYRPHRDRGELASWPAAARRRIAAVVFLNDDFEGGELRLIADDDVERIVVPKTGTLVAFDAETLHEVLPVTSGTRDTIVDWYLDQS